MTNMLKKVFNWSEVHLSDMTCYKIHNYLILEFWTKMFVDLSELTDCQPNQYCWELNQTVRQTDKFS